MPLPLHHLWARVAGAPSGKGPLTLTKLRVLSIGIPLSLEKVVWHLSEASRRDKSLAGDLHFSIKSQEQRKTVLSVLAKAWHKYRAGGPG